MSHEPSNLPALPDDDHRVRRWVVARDLVAFQFKLLLDGLKDLLLVPVSLVAGLVGILTSPRDPGRAFYGVLRLGDQLDRWINLYGAVTPSRARQLGGVDAHLGRLESALRDEYARGGAVAKAKGAVDRAVDAVGALDPGSSEESDPDRP